MDNAIRTAEHLARLAGRREALTASLAAIPPGGWVWEIGCGHGHFLTAFAQAHPETVCVGVDVTGDRVERAARKRDRARLSNLHFLQADARMFLELLPAAATLAAVYVLFPDPWPKKRHHKHRLMQPDFLGRIAARAGEGARLYFRTDHAPYFAAVQAMMAAHPAWRVVDEVFPFESRTVFQERAGEYRSLAAALRL